VKIKVIGSDVRCRIKVIGFPGRFEFYPALQVIDYFKRRQSPVRTAEIQVKNSTMQEAQKAILKYYKENK
jgi:hypothetical protein